jgi:hypothetical protein
VPNKFTKHSTHRDQVIEKLNYRCTLLADAQRYYVNAPKSSRRDLNQSVFDRIYVRDDDVAGTDATEPYRRLLCESLELDLMRERKRAQTLLVRTKDLEKQQGWETEPTEVGPDRPLDEEQNARDARLSEFLTLERLRERLPWERKNLGPVKVRGSDVLSLVVLSKAKTNTLIETPDVSDRSTPPPGPGRPRVTRKQQNEVVALYESGLSTRVVAERVGVAKTTVLRALGLAGIEIRPRGSRGRQ